MKITNKIVCVGILLLFGCAGTMLPGKMYVSPGSTVMQFSIEKSRGQGKMTAFNQQTGENFTGNYSTYGIGDKVRGEGTLVGDKGRNIKMRLTVKPGIRPTGRGTGIDQEGNRYEVIF